jgi:hypothetical protein
MLLFYTITHPIEYQANLNIMMKYFWTNNHKNSKLHTRQKIGAAFDAI